MRTFGLWRNPLIPSVFDSLLFRTNLVPYGHDHDFCVLRKFTHTYFEDDYQYDEILLMEKYMKPRMSIVDEVKCPSLDCLVLAEGSVNGYENRFCERTTVLLFNLDLCKYGSASNSPLSSVVSVNNESNLVLV